MANTFKFGNGNWAVKDGSALAYNDENNNFKPLPFDFTRASSATTLNRQGLIETVGSGKPRIDFTDNTSGHLLLEPSRTNQFTYSEFTNADPVGWTLGFGTGTYDYDLVSYKGRGALKQTQTTTGRSYQYQNVTLLASTTYTLSMYVDISNSNVTNIGEDIIHVIADDDTGDNTAEWQDIDTNTGRVSITFTTGSDTSVQIRIGLGVTGNTLASNQVLIYSMPQIEAGSYATSYIPTEGSSVTRVVDDIHLTFPDVDSFNSSSGFSVIAKFDIGAPNGSSSVPFLFFNDDSSNTYIGFGSNTTYLRCRLNLSGAVYLNTQSNAPRTQRNSLFISCDSSGWSQGANGSTNHTGTNNASVFDRLASITFSTSETYGIIKISELLVYNTRLSNTELQNLTS